MKITIDNREIEVTDATLNIVEIAKENGITIPAPCFNLKMKFGCCSSCIIEIEGMQKYACCTKPTDGMNIIFKREDLKNLRKEKMKLYSYNKKHGTIGPCDCNTNSEIGCCSGDSTTSCC